MRIFDFCCQTKSKKTIDYISSWIDATEIELKQMHTDISKLSASMSSITTEELGPIFDAYAQTYNYASVIPDLTVLQKEIDVIVSQLAGKADITAVELADATFEEAREYTYIQSRGADMIKVKDSTRGKIYKFGNFACNYLNSANQWQFISGIDLNAFANKLPAGKNIQLLLSVYETLGGSRSSVCQATFFQAEDKSWARIYVDDTYFPLDKNGASTYALDSDGYYTATAKSSSLNVSTSALALNGNVESTVFQLDKEAVTLTGSPAFDPEELKVNYIMPVVVDWDTYGKTTGFLMCTQIGFSPSAFYAATVRLSVGNLIFEATADSSKVWSDWYRVNATTPYEINLGTDTFGNYSSWDGSTYGLTCSQELTGKVSVGDTIRITSTVHTGVGSTVTAHVVLIRDSGPYALFIDKNISSGEYQTQLIGDVCDVAKLKAGVPQLEYSSVIE